ncbi:MAG: carboxylating nicotinate-nucleotide diphosphorylase [Bacteroidia bacterium]|nr:carboxylating nicotinate-nucleotide diphosphorylase [Bacteroidia bacterium]
MTTTQFIAEALREDVGTGDHSSLACVPNNSINKAKLLVKDNGILAGVNVALEVFKQVDDQLHVEVLIHDGDTVKYGDIALYVSGSAQSILKAERLVLNIMQRMSGIATRTQHFVQLVKGTNCKLLDTRKTTPNMRLLEKQAVLIGGGHNHRFGLYDMIMLKDNHVDYAGGIAIAINKANAYIANNNLKLDIEIETRNLNEVQQVLAVGNVQRIMLDNFTPAQITEALALINKRYQTEASGGITEETIAAYAATGVDYISVGALTHSIKSLDLSLKAV